MIAVSSPDAVAGGPQASAPPADSFSLIHVNTDADKLALKSQSTPAMQVLGGILAGTYQVAGEQFGRDTYSLPAFGAYNILQYHSNTSRWTLSDAGSTVIYYIVSNSLTPPSSGWLNASGGSPADITVAATSIPGLIGGEFVVINQEGGRLEQFLGPLTGEAGAGVTVSGIGDADGVYAFRPNGSDAYYNLQGKGPNTSFISGSPGIWSLFAENSEGTIVGGYVSNGAFPWSNPWYLVDPQTGVPTTTGPVPNVTRNDVVSNANWLVLRDTVNLTVGYANPAANYDGPTFLTVNGVTFDGTSGMTNVGWVDPTKIAIAIDGPDTGAAVSGVIWDNYNQSVMLAAPSGMNGSCTYCLPVVVPDRQTDVILTITI